MVLDGPAHCALSVMTLIALAGPRGPRTASEIADELELPAGGVNRALRDLTAARLLTVELEPARIGYAAARPPSSVTIAEIIEAAHPDKRTGRGSGPDAAASARENSPSAGPAQQNGRRGAGPADRSPGDQSPDWNPADRARQGLMGALARITLSDVLHGQFRRVRP